MVIISALSKLLAKTIFAAWKGEETGRSCTKNIREVDVSSIWQTVIIYLVQKYSMRFKWSPHAAFTTVNKGISEGRGNAGMPKYSSINKVCVLEPNCNM